jgi:hypothetical protein
MSKELYQSMAKQTAEKFGLPVPLFMGLVDHESGWNPNAVSSAGARGLGQVMPANLKRLGIDQATYDKDPALQLNQAAFFLRDAIRQAGGDPVMGLAYYNASPKAVNRWREGKAGLPTETANYVPIVMRASEKFGAAPLPSGAMNDIKARFGSRISDKTLAAKTGQAVNPASYYHDPSKDPGLDGVPMADASAPALAAPAAVPPTQVAQAPIEVIPTPAPTVAAVDPTIQNLATGEFDISAALGLSQEQPKHQYPSWFGKMVENEVATA